MEWADTAVDKISHMVIKTRFAEKKFIAILSNYRLGEYKSSHPIAEVTVQTNFFIQTTIGRDHIYDPMFS
jgi:hypothetical protein